VSAGAVQRRTWVSVVFDRGDLHLELDLPDDPFVALTGPNGAGKTSALRCLAGLEAAARVDWASAAPARIGYLPQRVMLYPAMSLADNIASSLRFLGVARAAALDRAAELLDLVDISELGQRRPHEVSGGQRQRAGLARSIAATPDLLLLDEPFSAIDADSRAHVRARIIDHIAASGAHCVLATHDHADIEAAAASMVAVR
jgi:ABC-type sulfate/molybdate transport systems ATPase subunit